MQKIPINQTLIKELEKPNTCPKKIYVMCVAKTHERGATESMLKGSYFETKVLGAEHFGEKAVFDLPRKKNGQCTIDHARIDLQAQQFPEVIKKYGIRMPKKNARQIMITLEKNNVLLYGTIDFVSPMEHPEYGSHPVAVIDLKLTKDRESTFGDFCWGLPENMDHLQGLMYPYLFKENFKDHLPKGYTPPFYYLVFDYKPEFGNKLIPVEYDAYYEEKLWERIFAANDKLLEMQAAEWPAEPDYEQCKNCPLSKSGECTLSPSVDDTVIDNIDDIFS